MRAFFALAGLAVAALVLAGCSLGTDQLRPPALGAAEAPDLARLVGKIQNTFKAVKLSGYPRISRPRRAPISAFGDWIVCLRSDAENSGIYALFISGSEIVDYRLALMIDDCAKESFAPLPPAPLTK